MSLHTPMMQQYMRLKDSHKGALLFFRLGDFYELFFNDAQVAASILNIALTKRGDIPMCGVPFHAHESYVAKLIHAGHKVAICEQTETPEEAKKRGAKSIVSRDVVRIITPGTLMEDNLLTEANDNFLMSLCINGENYRAAIADISTGHCWVEKGSTKTLDDCMHKYNPKEVLLTHKNVPCFRQWQDRITVIADTKFHYEAAHRIICSYYSVGTLSAFGLDNDGISALGGLVDYIQLTQKEHAGSLRRPKCIENSQYLCIDAVTLNSLEVFYTVDGKSKGSFFDTINFTHTAFGARKLASWLRFPLKHKQGILTRQQHVMYIQEHPRRDKFLKGCPDGERILSRLLARRGSPRDMYSFLVVLKYANDTAACLDLKNFPISAMSSHKELQKELEKALNDNAPNHLRDGGAIRKGYDAELDDLREASASFNKKLVTLQERYKETTNIGSLKIRSNNVIGAFIEVTHTHKDKVPEWFIHRQTLVSTSRYVTEELVDLQEKSDRADRDKIAKEELIFTHLVDKISMHKVGLRHMLEELAYLDSIGSFARAAHALNWVRPDITDGKDFAIVDAKHPVVAKSLTADQTFIPNSCHLKKESPIWLITGPNMAGKSTFLRQNALLILLAQMGACVPAAKAKIGLVDRVFSRVGASDNLSKGLSTFMVEMLETASILHQASERSFIILDEIGRGTATYDGLAIAWATLEHLQDLGVRCLFATHYHELTKNDTTWTGVAYHTVSVKEWEGKVIFLHKVCPGKADRSYGIHVAQMAGFPECVITRAKQILAGFSQHSVCDIQKPTSISEKESPVLSELRSIQPDTMSPRDALDFLYKIKTIVT